MKTLIRSIFLLALLVGTALPMQAQTEKGFNYQAVARDSNDELIVNTSITVRFLIRSGSTSGTLLYDETHTPTTNDHGLFTVVIGEAPVFSGVFANIDWGADDHFMQVFVNGVGVGAQEFEGVPYAKWAKNGSKWQENGTEIYYDQDFVGIGKNDPIVPLDVAGNTAIAGNVINATVTHNFSSDSRALNGVSTPAPGYGYGVYGTGGYVGVRSLAAGSSYTGSAYGLYSLANGSAGTRYGVYSAANNSGGTNAYGVFGTASGASTLYGVYGTVSGGTEAWAGYFAQRVRIATGEEASLTTNGYLELGMTTGSNLILDNNEITARNNGAMSDLFLQPNQGNVTIGTTSSLSAALGVDDTDGVGNIVRFRTGGSTKFTINEDGGTNMGTSSNSAPANGAYINGDVLIGTTSGAAGYKVSINGKVMCEELRVQNSTAWPDYVFTETHNRPSLQDLSKSIVDLGHLPGVPTAAEVDENGVMVGEMQRILLEKVEELTLYLIEADKRISALEQENVELRNSKGQ